MKFYKDVITKREEALELESDYGDYKNPPIPYNYEYLTGNWNTGIVIQSLLNKGQFVWVPVGSLESNGTIDGNLYNKKFGRRNFNGEELSKFSFYEPITEELILQIQSVKKYGGFYISRYNISALSKEERAKTLRSHRFMQPIVNLWGFEDYQSLAKMFDNNVEISSHLVYGAEYDSAIQWFYESGARTWQELTEDATLWGNFGLNPYSQGIYQETNPIRGHGCLTGMNPKWYTNNIADFAGNCFELTQEIFIDYTSEMYPRKRNPVVRGGYWYPDTLAGGAAPANRVDVGYYTENQWAFLTSFRVALWLK